MSSLHLAVYATAMVLLGLLGAGVMESCNETARYKACIEHHPPRECEK
jgi:hypothetical protein